MILPLLALLSAGAGAQPATPAAGSVVRSREWVVRRGKSREEEFIGDVRYDAADAHLSADWALYRQDSDEWRARGSVRARKTLADGTRIEAAGESARYGRRTGEGTLAPAPGGRVIVRRTPPGAPAPDRGEGDLLSWRAESAGVLSGRARVAGPRGEAWAETIRYEDAPPRRIALGGGRPVAHDYADGTDAALKADAIVADDAPRRAVADGRVVGWILFPSSAAPARCAPGLPGPDARVSALLAPGATDDEARFWEAETSALAARACAWGPRVEFWSEEAVAEELPRRRLTLTGGRPLLRKFDADGAAALQADRVVALAAARRVEAEGSVVGWLTFPNGRNYLGERR